MIRFSCRHARLIYPTITRWRVIRGDGCGQARLIYPTITRWRIIRGVTTGAFCAVGLRLRMWNRPCFIKRWIIQCTSWYRLSVISFCKFEQSGFVLSDNGFKIWFGLLLSCNYLSNGLWLGQRLVWIISLVVWIVLARRGLSCVEPAAGVLHFIVRSPLSVKPFIFIRACGGSVRDWHCWIISLELLGLSWVRFEGWVTLGTWQNWWSYDESSK